MNPTCGVPGCHEKAAGDVRLWASVPDVNHLVKVVVCLCARHMVFERQRAVGEDRAGGITYDGRDAERSRNIDQLQADIAQGVTEHPIPGVADRGATTDA